MDKSKSLNETPLVSVIIPCYNHGYLLSEAIESVLRQTYSPVEIVVVDDGSSDSITEVTKSFPGVKYFYQENQGLSSARNLGITKSMGELLVFLDADDLLLDYSIDYNVKFLQENKGLAFVSGTYQVTTLDNRILGDKKEIVLKDHYLYFLKSNYIGMLAAVMFKRFVFDEFKFDATLKACEDHDIYLKVARKYPVAHHSKLLTSYRMHDSNMSGNNVLMLKYALEVLSRQKDILITTEEKNAYKMGVKNVKSFYTRQLFNQLRKGNGRASNESIKILRKNSLFLYMRLILINI